MQIKVENEALSVILMLEWNTVVLHACLLEF